MERFKLLLLDVWREACQHIEIGQSADTIARLLLARMPLARLLVRRIDAERSHVETVAVGPGGDEFDDPVRTECPPDEMKRLVAWCERNEILHHGRADQPTETAKLITPPSLGADVLAGPLWHNDQPTGLLILAAQADHRFNDDHEQMFRALLEPFAVALDNDRRLREMVSLREAAEADRRSLLSRLGRQDIADTIVGAQTGLRPVMERVDLVARSDAPVLIFGETGSGKEVIARAIHSGSPRAAGPFMRVNCGAISPELIDSELFGHEKGSFTGAIADRKGWFERADGGTLFLDEVGELPLAAQVRLLRVLQDGLLERVGAQHQIKVDVRIVAATHRDLAAMVAQQHFRQDLWYRLAVFPIVLPPLRERKQDIPALAEHCARRAATRFGLPVLMPTRQDMKLLVNYPWPGNVRELAAVIDRAAILGDGKRLEIATALGVFTANAAAATQTSCLGPASDSPSPQTILPLDHAMRRHIEATLAATTGRIEGPHGAAAILKINPHTLRARMRKLGIDWIAFRG